jgi:hypothetical protein
MDGIAQQPADRRAELFRETGTRIGLSPALVEKDFWVCWTLKQLFSLDELRGKILFKGGTSLSKIFNAIRRFSEDIDLAVDFEMLGFTGNRHPAAASSRTKRQVILDEMLIACCAYIEEEFLALLNQRFASVLGDPSGWQLRTRPSGSNSVVVEFEYPASLRVVEAVAYVRPIVILEPGTHAEFIPRDKYQIQPFAAEQFPTVFSSPACDVEAIIGERTFWEKATILHAEYHRPTDKPLAPRHSRHYYDTAMLAVSPIKAKALADQELLKRVVRHKSEFYHSGWARYDLAIPGSFRLVPAEHRLRDLWRDYQAMRAMIFEEPPSWDWIIETLLELEGEINSLKA